MAAIDLVVEQHFKYLSLYYQNCCTYTVIFSLPLKSLFSRLRAMHFLSNTKSWTEPLGDYIKPFMPRLFVNL